MNTLAFSHAKDESGKLKMLLTWNNGNDKYKYTSNNINNDVESVLVAFHRMVHLVNTEMEKTTET